MSKSPRCARGWQRGAVCRASYWLVLGFVLAVSAGCASLALPTPDQGALAVLPTSTPTVPTRVLDITLGPRPSDTPSPTTTPTPTATPTATPSPTPTATPTSTPTATPGPLARALGMDHHLLGRFDSAGYTVAELQRVSYAGERFLAVIVAPPPQQEDVPAGIMVPRLLVYHLPGSGPSELIFEDEGSDEVIQFAGYGLTWEKPLGWRDLTGDDLLELPVWAANGGFCFACTRVYMLQLMPVEDRLNPEGETRWQVRELTGAVPFLNLLQEPIIPKWFSDYNGDGKAEIEALDGSFEFAFGLDREYSPRIYRPLFWDGSDYVDTSGWNPAYFDGQIGRASEAVQAGYGQPLTSQDPIGHALTVLLAYDAGGRRADGWEVFWQLSDPANWSAESDPALLDLLGRIREHLRGQNERGEPFAPWPPTTPGLLSPSDVGDTGVQPPEASGLLSDTTPLPPAEPAPPPEPGS